VSMQWSLAQNAVIDIQYLSYFGQKIDVDDDDDDDDDDDGCCCVHAATFRTTRSKTG